MDPTKYCKMMHGIYYVKNKFLYLSTDFREIFCSTYSKPVVYLTTSNELKYAGAFVLGVWRALRPFSAQSEIGAPWKTARHLSAAVYIRLASFMDTMDKNRGHAHNKVFVTRVNEVRT